MDELKATLSKSRQELKYIKDISGVGSNGKTKAQIKFRLLELQSNRIKKILNEVTTDIPVLSIFKHAGAVNMYLDFGSPNNPDCISLDKLLDEYLNPTNHFPYLLEELNSEKYLDGEEEKDIYFSAFEVIISPIDSESEYKILAYNPQFYNYEPSAPYSKNPSIVQLTFPDDLFSIVDKLDDKILQEIHNEVFQIIRDEEIIKCLSYSNNDEFKKKEESIFINDISGYNTQTRKTKAHVVIRFLENNSDGTEDVIDTIHIDKPIVYIEQKNGHKEINLDFGSARDQDLQYIWKMLKDYSAPENSISYTIDEIETGIYNDGEADRLVYFPSIQINLRPIGKESDYEMIAFNPLLYSLKPGYIPVSQPGKVPEPSMISFMVEDEFFVITTDLDYIDMNSLQQEVLLSDKEHNPYI